MKNSGIEWIGEIPSEWKILKGKWTLKRLERTVKETDGVITCFRDGEVTLRSNRREDGFTFSLQEIGYQGIEPGDLVVHGMDGFAGAIGISNSRGKATPVLNVMDCTECKKYIMYYLRNMAYNGIFFSLATGIRVRSCDTSWNKLKELPYLIPKIETQQKIASFLDQKCAEIDAVIEKTKATIEEYKKLKQSVITEAVTKGIRGNRPMKDSGIEWIGEIPVGWDIIPLQYFADLNKETLGENTSPEYEFDYVEIGAVTLEKGIGEYQHYKFSDAPSRARRVVHANDIIISTVRTYLKAIAIVPYKENLIVSTGFAVLTPKNIHTEYLGWSLKSNYFVNMVSSNSVGISYPAINASNLIKFKITIPSTDEQKEIADYLDQKCAEIDTLIAKKTTLLTELETYKKSLIYEYVTGKKEVGEDTASTQVAVYSPYFPVIIKVNNIYNALKAFMFGILDKCNYDTGRVKLEKMMFVAQHSIGFDLGNEYSRAELGPLDSLFYQCEYDLVKDGCIIKDKKRNIRRIYYKAGRNNHKYKEEYNRYFADCDAEIDRIINIFKDYDVQKSERIATLFGAWNDAIIDKRQFTDEDIVEDVLNNWHEHKGDYSRKEWLDDLEEMKKINLIPKGYGKKTVFKKD